MFHALIAVFNRACRFIIIIWIYFLYSYAISSSFVLFASMWCAANFLFIHEIQIREIFVFSFSAYYEFMNAHKIILDSVWINFLFLLLVFDSNRLIVSRSMFFSNENCQCIHEFWTIELKNRNEFFCFSIMFLTPL